jgi:hypothetical protein
MDKTHWEISGYLNLALGDEAEWVVVLADKGPGSGRLLSSNVDGPRAVAAEKSPDSEL